MAILIFLLGVYREKRAWQWVIVSYCGVVCEGVIMAWEGVMGAIRRAWAWAGRADYPPIFFTLIREIELSVSNQMSLLQSFYEQNLLKLSRNRC